MRLRELLGGWKMSVQRSNPDSGVSGNFLEHDVTPRSATAARAAAKITS